MSHKPPFMRSAYNYDTNQASDEAGLKCEDKSLARQEFAEEVDINTIVHRFGLDGQMPENIRMPTSGDFTNIPDFQSAMNALRAAQESFDAMPARVRARFHNDPAEFVAFCDDENNRTEAIRMGLVTEKIPEPEPTPMKVTVVESTPAIPPTPKEKPSGK